MATVGNPKAESEHPLYIIKPTVNCAFSGDGAWLHDKRTDSNAIKSDHPNFGRISTKFLQVDPRLSLDININVGLFSSAVHARSSTLL